MENNVSVIIPTCNRPQDLKNAVNSVIEQTVKPSEIVVINDASDADYGASVDELRKRSLKENIDLIYYGSDVKIGVSASRNLGVSKSKSNIIMFLDDDDTWTSSKIESQIQVFQRDDEIGLVYSGRNIIHGKNIHQIQYKVRPERKGDLFPEILFNNYVGVTSSISLKRNIFNKAGGFDEKLASRVDYDLWIRCSKLTKISHDGECNVNYTIDSLTGNQISRSKIEKHLKSVNRILDKYSDEIDALGKKARRKIEANHFFYLAKIGRKHGFSTALPWVLKALVRDPKLKYAISILPETWLIHLRRIID
jgi:glycosyltransferase involved in cell wall biosynthesis